MKYLERSAIVPGLASLILLAACSGDGKTSTFGGDLYVSSCSLGCTNGQGGEQVFCTVVNTFRNQEIVIRFSEPILLSSVNSSSFRVVNVANGTSPQGEFFLDPLDGRRLIFRPSLTFDSSGNPQFGFRGNTAYQITIPGEVQGDSPPFITSVAGNFNQSRLQCTILTSDDLIDPVPGPPTVRTYADRVVSSLPNGDPDVIDYVDAFPTQAGCQWDGFGTDGLENNLINGAVELTRVWRGSCIYMLFADIMNPATLANPSPPFNAPFITVKVDEDGSLVTSADRSTIAGTYFAIVDTERLETLVLFDPALELPSAGSQSAIPRRVVVNIPESCRDLVDNRVTTANGGGVTGFIPEVVQFDPLILPLSFGPGDPDGEQFQAGMGTLGSGEDESESGAVWGGGMLTNGWGGSTGRHGELVVRQGQVVTLNTDSQDFPLTIQGGAEVPNVIGNIGDDPNFPTDFPRALTVTDGIFEFSALRIEGGGALRLVGTNPARIYVRGPVLISAGGILDLSGANPPAHDSMTPAPYLTVPNLPDWPDPAPGARPGGFGGDRWSAPTQFNGLPAPSNAIQNPNLVSLDGRDGTGINSTNPSTGPGRGRGGAGNPVLAAWPTGVTNISGTQWNEVFVEELQQSRCFATRVAGSGSGGAYSLDGSDGISESPFPSAQYPLGANNNGPTSSGGVSADVGLEPANENNTDYTFRKLDWALGYLRAGSGGGGGGTHYYRALGLQQTNCLTVNLNTFFEWHDHSGATGGGGGGALHLTSGRRLDINGRIDASGGQGGSALQAGVGAYNKYAMPGGGGSGGALRLQARTINISANAGRLDISGGEGGTAAWAPASHGGQGGPGLVRIEDLDGTINHLDIAPSISPFFGDGLPPFEDDKSIDFLSPAPGGWALPRRRPGSLSGSGSCWIVPVGNWFALNFSEDAGTQPADMGWNMDVLWDPPGGPGEMAIPYRGSSAVWANGFDVAFGNYLGHDSLTSGIDASPIVVRFQGARTTSSVANPCDVALTGATSPIVAGTLTPWVDHPSKLNEFQPTPNMIRYVILFDGTLNVPMDQPGATLYSSINGVTNLRITVNPD